MIHLIQPRHIYAPNREEDVFGHIYMPTSLLTAAAILINAGQDVKIIDENIDDYIVRNNILGINLLGAPYIPIILKYIHKLKTLYNDNYSVYLGGQTIDGLRPNEFSRLFGEQAYNGNDFSIFAKNLNYEVGKNKCPENISLINAYKCLPTKNLKLYLASEQSFYLSQGCKFSCTFCTAKRTGYNPWLNKKISIQEDYRNIEIALLDIEYLITKSIEFSIPSISLYLSNLDLFQSPDLLFEFSSGLIELKKKYNSFPVKFRGLATVRSFLKTDKHKSYVIEKSIEAGLYQVGFGIDGATYQVYKLTRKPQTAEECLRAIQKLREKYDLTPETLMVFGHNYKEDKAALDKAYRFSVEMYNKYGALPRPHVAKDIVPGNDGWFDSNNKKIVENFLANPWLFQNLDFTALPSLVTHPDENFRILVTNIYTKMCSLPNSLTQVVKPFDIYPDKESIEFNNGKYDI